jgi:hypothetical protein
VRDELNEIELACEDRPPGWTPRAFIPNREGYRLRVLLANGRIETVTVARDALGRHYLPDVPITLVQGWRPA